MKNQGKPVVVREISVIFIQVREKSGKTNFFSPHIIFIDLCMAVCKVVVPFPLSKCKLYHFA